MNIIKYLFLIVSILILNCSERNSVGTDTDRNSITEISGSVSGIYEANKNYKVYDQIQVDANSVLVIEPGVRIIFEDSASFVVKGNLQCLGIKENSITFSSIGSKWKGIKIINASDTSLFQFCTIENVLLEEADSLSYGAIVVANSNVIINNTIFKNNCAVSGGALYSENSSVTINNSIFNNNRAIGFGGGILLFNSETNLINNIFYKNYSQNSGGGVAVFQSENSNIQNNIFYQNSASINFNNFYIHPLPSTNYIEQYNFWGNDIDPMFISDDNLKLRANSPCIDAGNPNSIFNDKNGTRNDMGAYGGPGGDW